MTKQLLTTMLGLAFVSSAFASNPPAESTMKWISPVDFSHVKIDDGFWSPRLEKHRSATLPVCIDQIENQTGRMRNFENAGKGEGQHSGIYFDDSDVYKAIEGIAYSLKNYPDAELEKKADEWIAKIASAQQPDGYINTFYTLTGLENRWKDMDRHEMYCAGHMIEAGVAYYQATGKRTLLDVGQRMADHMMTIFGPGKRHWVAGHEEIELALVKLADVTNENKYIDFANWLIEERGHGHGSFGDSRVWNKVYYQDDKPVREMTDIAGHAVRCMYLYCGVADVAALKHDEGYMKALDRLWDDVVLKNMYITGGIGSSHHNEGFTVDYDMPNKEAYCETCASVGMVLWNERMNQFTGDTKYIDVLERSMYNGALAGISISGDRFFYVNPLESDGGHHRQAWYGCACCPSQVSRFLPSIGNYVYDISDKAVWVNLFMGGKATFAVGGNDITLTQNTNYPWNGDVEITVETGKKLSREFRLRIPGWCKKYDIKVNGKAVKANVDKGYAVIKRSWKNGDKITLSMDMPVEMVAADPRVKANVGKRAIQRGPIVYCLEEADNGGETYALAHLTPETTFTTTFEPNLLGGVQTISLTTDGSTWKLIPYYAWDNRQAGRMKVWLDYKAGAYTNNRLPLLQKTFMELPLGSIKAEGWLADQLGRMKDGMTGHMDSIYSKVMGKRNGWLGGDGDVWERGPYWIDGLLPLAYILDDEELKAKVQPWIEWTLASQKPNGYFGPDTDRPWERGLQRDNSHDWWPKMVMLKVMQQYYSATGDERVIPFFTNYFRYQLAELPKTPLGHWTFWGQQRGGDNLMMVYWLYNITGERFLLDLATLIHRQTNDWTDIFLNRDHLYRPYSLHCVNLGQGFKEPAVYYQQSLDHKHLRALDTAVEKMRHTIGLPTGLWGGDELLRFGLPTTGSELCTATEMMYSLEEILEITGRVKWADYLERVAYNALPTQITDDFDARQYYQQTNQVCVTREWREFSTPHDDTDVLFGELTGYPCCTSNLHQGWPKLTQNLWYATADEGLAALVYAPSSVKAKVAGGVEVGIKETTDYPFGETINLEISLKDAKKAAFPIHLRIPEWCNNASIEVNGKKVEADTRRGNIAIVSQEWKNGDQVTLRLPMEVSVSRWYDQSAVVERGPLLYALKMEENWEKKQMEEDKQEDYGKWYYEVTSPTPWNYALPHKVIDRNNIKEAFSVETRGVDGKYPWNVDNAPVSIKVKALRLNNWTLVRGSAGPVPFYTQQGRDYSEEETIELIPYGCTTLRITEFPVR